MSKRSRPWEDHHSHRHPQAPPPPKRYQFSSTHHHPDTKRVTHEQALTQLPPTTTPILTPKPTKPQLYLSTPPHPPILPPILPSLSNPVFTHKSTLPSYNRTVITPTSTLPSSSSSPVPEDTTYERLEFLGDAYLELFASRLLFSRFAHLPAGRLSQLRELMVKNETLAEYARRYGFEERVRLGEGAGEIRGDFSGRDGGGKGNKGWNKILGDVFEAYVAAVVLSGGYREGEDGGREKGGELEGMRVADEWLSALWSVKIVEQMERDGTLRLPGTKAGGGELEGGEKVVGEQYSATGKMNLQKRIGGPKVTLLYERYHDSIELKGSELGQSRHFIALYLTGYGKEKFLLGRGEGKSKAEAGNRAAVEAMYGEHKDFIDECETVLKKEKEIRAEQKAQEAAAKLEGAET